MGSDESMISLKLQEITDIGTFNGFQSVNLRPQTEQEFKKSITKNLFTATCMYKTRYTYE